MRTFVSTIVLLLVACSLGPSHADHHLTKVGDFNTYQHGVRGSVYAKNAKTLVVKGFEYDGAGPDAFFWAGTSGSPSTVGIILPHPFKGVFYDYEDQSAPILSGRFDGSNDIELTLPEGTEATDLKWLSVWCRAFSVNFGDLIADFTLGGGEGSEAEAESESEPETVSETFSKWSQNEHPVTATQ